MSHDLQTKLAAPFADSDIEWRLQWSDDEKGSGIAVPYVTNRAIQNRLDKTVGVDCWRNEYIPWHSDGKKASQICGISIYFAERKEWITKYDGAEDSDIEPVKGGLSDSMKRASVQWGIGRYLYEMDTVFVDTEKRGRTTVIKKSSQPKLDAEHQRTIKKMFSPEQPKAPQLAPAEQPDAQQQSTETPAPTSEQKPAAIVRHPAAPPSAIPDNAYCVISAVIQPSISGQNTLLQLKGADEKPILVYMQGVNPAIVAGVWLENVEISSKIKEGVVFSILNSYDLAAQQAA